MRKIPFIDQELYIDIDFNIYNYDKEIIHTLKLNGTSIRLTIDDISRTVELSWIYRVVNYYGEFAIYIRRARIFDIDFIETNLMSNNGINMVYIPIFTIPVVIIKDKRIYRMISSHPRYCISSDGYILDTKNNSVCNTPKNTVNKNYYSSIKLVNSLNSNIRTSIQLHRLVALTWLENTNYLVNIIVNHIDGNKQNYNSSNLEWTTYSLNNKHAIDTGLRYDNIGIKLKDLNNKKVSSFTSLTDATKFIGRSRLTLTHIDIIGTGKLVYGSRGTYEVKYTNDNTAWVMDESPKLLVSRNQKTRAFIIKNGNTTICNNTKEVIDFMEINKYPYTDYFTRLDLKRAVERIGRLYHDLVITIKPINNYSYTNKTYICRNVSTGIEVILRNRKELITLTNGSKSAIQKSISTNGRYSVNGWILKLNDGIAFDKLIIPKNMNIRLAIMNIENNETVIVNSLSKASELIGVTRDTIKSVLKKNGKIYKYSIKYYV